MRRTRLLARVLGWLVAATPAAAGEADLPRPDHVVVVILENHSSAEILGNADAPFLNELATGAVFNQSFAVSHPSEPNYFALFTGSTQGVTDDGRYSFSVPTLAGALRAVGKSFVGYAERGSPRKHNPWESFAESQAVAADMTAFPQDFSQLPTVSFVVPNEDNDMHDGSVARADSWLQRHLGAYAAWCARNGSLLIVTFDEDDHSQKNRVATVFVGESVLPGSYDQRISHYTLLRTIEAMYGLPPLGESRHEQPITSVWRAAPASPPE